MRTRLKQTICPWSKVVVSVCSKCHGQERGEALKDFLKARMRAGGHAGACRVINSSCLGLCPEGEQAILVQPQLKNGIMLVVDDVTEREEIVTYLTNVIEEN